MNYGHSYKKTIDSLKTEIKRINDRKKQLYAELQATELRLYSWMVRHNLEEFEGYKRDKLQPKEKPKIIRKKKKEKEADALRLFRNTGIPDPEEFWIEFKNTQKSIQVEDDE